MIQTTTRTTVHVICDGCGKDAPPADTNGEAIEQAIDSGFWRVSYRHNGVNYAVDFYCHDCAEKKQDELYKIKNVSIRMKEE